MAEPWDGASLVAGSDSTHATHFPSGEITASAYRRVIASWSIASARGGGAAGAVCASAVCAAAMGANPASRIAVAMRWVLGTIHAPRPFNVETRDLRPRPRKVANGGAGETSCLSYRIIRWLARRLSPASHRSGGTTGR